MNNLGDDESEKEISHQPDESSYESERDMAGDAIWENINQMNNLGVDESEKELSDQPDSEDNIYEVNDDLGAVDSQAKIGNFCVVQLEEGNIILVV